MVQRELCTRLMGSDFELIVVETDHQSAGQRLQEGVGEIQRIESLLTEFNDFSQTSLLNKNSGQSPVRVDREVYELVQRAVHISRLTQGAFDISAGALKALYRFKEKIPIVPTSAALSETLTRVGYRHICMFTDNRIKLSMPGMHISFSAIGKGYAADKVRSLWKSKGVSAGVVNASGDLTAWGKQPDGRAWNVGISNPLRPTEPLFLLPIADGSVATSGNYEQYFEIGGVRFSHNIDPRTGAPVRNIKSVSIISPSAELSDALATAVTVMGIDAGFNLIDQLPDIHGIVIDENDRVFTSQKINVHAYQQIDKAL